MHISHTFFQIMYHAYLQCITSADTVAIPCEAFAPCTMHVWQTLFSCCDKLVALLQLSSMELQNNNLTGTLPGSWGNLTQVSTLLPATCSEPSQNCTSTVVWHIVLNNIMTFDPVMLSASIAVHHAYESCSLPHSCVSLVAMPYQTYQHQQVRHGGSRHHCTASTASVELTPLTTQSPYSKLCGCCSCDSLKSA